MMMNRFVGYIRSITRGIELDFIVLLISKDSKFIWRNKLLCFFPPFWIDKFEDIGSSRLELEIFGEVVLSIME